MLLEIMVLAVTMVECCSEDVEGRVPNFRGLQLSVNVVRSLGSLVV
jgi:hypothetical protein